jgi:hypothetical protein
MSETGLGVFEFEDEEAVDPFTAMMAATETRLTRINLPAYPDGDSPSVTLVISSTRNGLSTSLDVAVEGKPSHTDEWHAIVGMLQTLLT